ncbi:MAG: dockerin type I domain-containing protein [Planctomycetota bacterium]
MKTGLSVLAAVLLCAAPGLGWGANGDITGQAIDSCIAPGIFTRNSDAAIDPVSGDLWVINQYSGSVCRYDTTPPFGLTATIAHPLGPAGGGAFPTNNFSVGIAATPTSTLWALNTGNPAGAVAPYMQQFDQAGVAIGGAITITLPDASTIPSGLTFDTSNNSLWYRDIGNHTLVNIDQTGALLTTLPIPGLVAGDTQMFGESLTYSEQGLDRYLTITQGDVFDFEVARAMRINLATGSYDGYSVPLGQLYTGFGAFIGDADSDTNRISGVAVAGATLWLTSGRSVYKVDATQPSLFPPSNLQVRALANGEMVLTWENHGSGAGGAYTNFSILRNGATIEVAYGGAETSYPDTSVAIPRLLNTDVTYEVVAIEGSFTSSATKVVRTGTGALMKRVPFDGTPAGMAFNSATDELWVAESIGGGTSNIHVFDESLNLVQTIPVAASLIRGIAYNPDLNWFAYSTGAANFENNLNFIDAATGAAPVGAATLSIGVPGVQVELGAIGYDTIAKDYLIVNVHPNDGGDVLRVEAEDNGMVTTPPTAGAFIDACSAGISVDFAEGVTFLENSAEGGFLATVEAGGAATQINEYVTESFLPGPVYVCTPSGSSIPLDSIGNSISQTGAVEGLASRGPIAYLGGGTSQSLFQVLLAPSAEFVRGDLDSSGTITLADAIILATYLFTPGGAAPQCLDAGDANDDGRIDISDPTYLIWHTFLSGPAPDAPYPAPGTDPTFLDGLPCS